MATINTPLYAAQTGAVSKWPTSILEQGKLRFASVTIPSGTVLAVGDKINLVRLPAQARVIPAQSISINGNATACADIGDAGVADRFAEDLGGVARKPLTDFGNKGDATLAIGNEDIIGTVTVAATLATDWRIYIAYTVV